MNQETNRESDFLADLGSGQHFGYANDNNEDEDQNPFDEANETPNGDFSNEKHLIDYDFGGDEKQNKYDVDEKNGGSDQDFGSGYDDGNDLLKGSIEHRYDGGFNDPNDDDNMIKEIPLEEDLNDYGGKPNFVDDGHYDDGEDETYRFRNPTLLEEVRTNDGRLYLEIDGHELRKKSSKEFVVYFIRGKDNLGAINIQRRYREFLCLRDTLFAQYPGLMIPPMPAKKYKGNKVDNFVEERRYFLNKFLK